MVKFTVFTLAFPGYTAEDAIRAVAKLGYDGVDIRVRQDGHIYIDAPKEYRKKLVELANSLGIRIVGVYSYLREEFIASDPGEKEKALKNIIAHLDLAVDLDGVYLRIFAGTKERTEENMRKFIEMCKLACKEAEDRGVFIGIETHGELAYSGDTCNRVLEEVGSEMLTIVYDVANIYRQNLDPLEELKKINLSRVISVQFHDFKKENGTWKPVLLGQGDIPHEPVIEYLKEKNYDGFIVDEYEKWWHPELPDPMEGLPKELSYLKSKFGVK